MKPKILSQVSRLLEIMQQLRDPQSGCPWDLKQSFKSIVPYTIEEAYEVADAIENGDMHEVKDELGDLLFQVVFYAQLAREQSEFDFDGIAEVVADKLIRRHPHVFAGGKLPSSADVGQQWEQIKQRERADKGQSDTSALANVPKGMAPLIRAQKLQKKCAKVGFDWPDVAPVLDKIQEEIAEVKAELVETEVDQGAVEEEIGDLLFAVVNLSRHVKVDAETALRKANTKFEQRFRAVEQILADQQKTLADASLDEMEAAWQQVKSTSRRHN